MKWLRDRCAWIAAGTLLVLTLAARADLARWVQDIDAASALRAVFFRTVPLPSGTVTVRRPPRETREELTKLLATKPTDADWLALRAREAEQQLDFTAAEADWKRQARSANGNLALADYYHRRNQPREEISALAAVAAAPSPRSERLLPPAQQRSWRALERVFALIDAHALPADVSVKHYQAWMARYPKEAGVSQRFFNFLLARKDFAVAEKHIATYQLAFPDDRVFPVRARASLAHARGAEAEALALYEQSYDPLWPPELVRSYFALLGETRNLRMFLDRTRAAIAANPDDVVAASRLFYYYQQQGNPAAARRALIEFRLRKESRRAAWTANDLWVLAQLLEGIQDSNEAARAYYALYSLPGAAPADTERALAGLIRLLFESPAHSVRFGSGDLTFYKDIATLDTGPGFLNGILSLIFNSVSPAERYATQEQSSVAYFHRAQAAELLALFEACYPQSAERPALRTRLIEAYALYGDADALIAAAQKFLADFPSAPQRTRVALLMAEGYARKDQTREEFAAYDALLEELAARADRVPLGAGASSQPQYARDEEGDSEGEDSGARWRQPEAPGVRSPEYARVLDRYIARLTSKRQPLQVLALYRREIVRNPSDPGLYERLASFLEQNNMGRDLEETYRRAMKQFQDRSWYHKLARWYLRRKRDAAFEQLTQEVTAAFSGSDLEQYFRETGGGGGSPQLYLRVNLYAHQRFPHNLSFVRNLLGAYTSLPTRDHAAWERLIREYWFYEEGLRNQFFEDVSRHGQLDSEVSAALALGMATSGGKWPDLARNNPAAARFLGEAAAWQSHFESAAPVLGALALEHPGDVDLGRRSASIFRSLAAFDPQNTDLAAGVEQNLARFDPRDRAALARVGEVYADRELLDKSRPWWNRIAAVEPGKADGYLESATVFWDYYQFDDALRLISEGRKKLGKPALYAYEAGAIRENQRDYRRAVDEYLRGALEQPHMQASQRLMTLARRPAHRALVEEATLNAVAGPNPSAAAFNLRVALLEEQNRRDELEKLLGSVVEGTSSFEMLENVDQIASRQGFDGLRRRTLERRIAMLSDPVERLRLRLTLVGFHEGRKDLDSARKEIEAVYAENSKVLGVVRAIVDFHWRHQNHSRAIEILTQAAAASHPALGRQFTFEAARKATASTRFEEARAFLAPLLKDEPFNGEYLATQADTYASAADDKGLRDFYLATITAMKSAPLPVADRNARIAALRRGLIPALTRLKDFTGAVDQYIEIINRYPEDEGLVSEAARYALERNLRDRLLAYYAKTESDSPRDFRWAMVTARLQTHFEDYSAAIAAYSRATRIRPDRSDLFTARGVMEERLMRFDEALATYERLYELSYRNPQWMEKIALVRARKGETDAAVAALQSALIEKRPERPGNFFEVARRLESWNMLPQARTFAERGVGLAGDKLLIEEVSGAVLYSRIMTRLRQHSAALERLYSSIPRPEPEDTPRYNLGVALREVGQTVQRYFSPEERAAFATYLEQQQSVGRSVQRDLLPLAQAAGLADLEARWRNQLMMAAPGTSEGDAHYARLVQLQRSRLQFKELGAQLEAYDRVYPRADYRYHVLDRAAEAYRAAGNTDAEFRVLSARFGMDGGNERYFELLLQRHPPRLVELAGPGTARLDSVRNAAANYIVEHGSTALALQAVANRGRGLNTLWTRAYTGLVGLHFSETTAPVEDAFRAALDTRPIGDRIGKPVNRDEVFAGELWFYYGSRYGEFRALSRHGDPEDYLPAMLEARPAYSEAYFTLADYYQETRQFDRAIADYDHALELDASRGAAHHRIAVMLVEQGKSPEAAARFRSALQAYQRSFDASRFPESLWSDVRATLEVIGDRKLLTELRPDADKLLRTYVRRNGSYRFEPLLRGLLACAGETEGITWLLDLAHAAPDEASFLNEVLGLNVLPDSRTGSLHRRIIELRQQKVDAAQGEAQGEAAADLRSAEIRYMKHLLRNRQPQRVRELLDAWPELVRQTYSGEVAVLEVRLASASSTLDALLTRYRSQPEFAPDAETLLRAARGLRATADAAGARRVLEFVYNRELERYNFAAANFLGLAEVRLEQYDVPAALSLLRRMNLISGEPFENLEAAADLLERMNRHAEAVEFRSARVRAFPWDYEARMRLARAQSASNAKSGEALTLLKTVASSADAMYSTRIDAALAWARAKAGVLASGSAELDAIASNSVTTNPSAAEQPLWFQARLEAARSAPLDQCIKLLQDAVAIDPESTTARQSLFVAALEAGRHQFAVAVFEPWLLRGGIDSDEPVHETDAESSAQQAGGDVDEVFEEGRYEYSSERYEADRFLDGSGLDRQQRAQMAARLASAYEKLGELNGALGTLRVAGFLETDPAARRSIEQRSQSLKSELARREQNARRRPKISPTLEQENVVRPRIAQVSAGKGGQP